MGIKLLPKACCSKAPSRCTKRAQRARPFRAHRRPDRGGATLGFREAALGCGHSPWKLPKCTVGFGRQKLATEQNSTPFQEHPLARHPNTVVRVTGSEGCSSPEAAFPAAATGGPDRGLAPRVPDQSHRGRPGGMYLATPPGQTRSAPHHVVL